MSADVLARIQSALGSVKCVASPAARLPVGQF